MSDISEARNSLGAILNVFSSLRNIDKILAALENADQVQKELTLANDAIRAQVADAQASLADVMDRANAITVTAAADVSRITADAHNQAADLIAAAENTRDTVLAQKADADAALAIVLEQRATAEAARDLAAEDYTEMTAKLSTAKAQLSALLV